MPDKILKPKSFVTVNEGGSKILVHEYQKMIEVMSRDGRQYVPGMKELLTDDGQPVNYKSKGHYEIVGHPMIPITSDDPNAP